MKQTWGKCLLTTEKRTAIWKGINIPSNCKVLNARDLNKNIQIRVNENAWKKDKAARERQKGMFRAAKPALYSTGNLSKSKDKLGKCYKMSSMEPKDIGGSQETLGYNQDTNKGGERFDE